MFFISLHELSKPHTAKSKAMAMGFFVFFVAYKKTTTTIFYLFFNCCLEKVVFGSNKSWCGCFVYFLVLVRKFVFLFFVVFASLVNAN